MAAIDARIEEQGSQVLRKLLGWFPIVWRRFSPALFIAVVLGGLGYLAFAEYSRHNTRAIEFYIGTWRGAGREPGRLIQGQAEKQSKEFRGGYKIALRGSDGFEENRRLINQDQTGGIIGFVHEGFGDASNLRLLLPLEWNYLHILCSADSLKQWNLRRSPSSGVKPETLTLKHLAAHLKSEKSRGRVYLGPRESGTRQLAELVLRHHGLVPDHISAPGIANWDDMRAALKTGQIDLAFKCGPLNDKVIESIAHEKSAVLVGLNGVADALVKQNEYLARETFEADSYRTGDFCPTPLETVASRRVLVCSSAMSEQDAFYLAQAADAALRSSINIRWDTLPPSEASRKARDFAIRLHPGAQSFQQGATPTRVWAQYGFILTPIAVFLSVELLRWLGLRIPSVPEAGPRAPEPGTGTPPSGDPAAADDAAAGAKGESYQEFLNEIDTRWEEIVDIPLAEARRRRQEWLKTVSDLRQRVNAARKANTLSANQWEKLRDTLANLRDRIDQLKKDAGPLVGKRGK
jgi:hypothetical protein